MTEQKANDELDGLFKMMWQSLSSVYGALDLNQALKFIKSTLRHDTKLLCAAAGTFVLSNKPDQVFEQYVVSISKDTQTFDLVSICMNLRNMFATCQL